MNQAARLAPDFAISLGKSPLKDALKGLVREIVVRRHQERSDSFIVRMADPKDDLFDSNAFKFGAAVTLKLGYVGALEEVFQGEITAQLVDRGPQGSTFVFRGFDKSHRLSRGSHHGAFTSKTEADVAKSLGKRAGVSLSVAAGWSIAGTLHQLGVSDRELLNHRARRAGRRLSASQGKLGIALQTYGSAVSTLEWEGQLSAADLEVDLATQVEEVRVRGRDPEKDQAIDEVVNASSLGWPKGDGKLGSARASSLFGASAHLIADEGPRDAKEATAIGKAHLARQSEAFISGPVTIVGTPGLAPGQMVDLGGLGAVMSGRYVIHGLSHFYSGAGFTTRLELGRMAA